jgi:hypothetical protein
MFHFQPRKHLLPVLAFAFAFPVYADPVISWSEAATAAAHAACLADNPLQESRLYAMVHLAIHDAVNAIDRRSRPYAYSTRAPAGASPDAAVAAAAKGVLASQIGSIGLPAECVAAGTRQVDAAYTAALAAMPATPARAEGIRVGEGAAAAIIARRAEDGSNAPMVDQNFPQGTLPGQWRFTPGSPPIAFGAQWGKVRPFALQNAAQFQPGPPIPIECGPGKAAGCGRYASDLEEIRRLGGDGKSMPSTRTPDQTQVALFWEESSPSSWNRIARDLATRSGLSTYQAARLFALMNTAMADGYIASWSTKFKYTFWRPVTAVREADADGNPATHGDKAWMSLRPTPPVPDYESAHALEGAAAAAVIRHVLGKDGVAITACSNSLPEGKCTDSQPVRRSFRSLTEAARENGVSRIYIGFHFRDAVDKGLKRGDQIGTWVAENTLVWER